MATSTGAHRKRAMSADAVTQRDSVHICVSSLLFENCGPLLPAPSGLTVSTISRLPAHCSLRAHITMAEWMTAADTAFALPSAVASRLFDVFFLLSQQQQHRIEYSRALALHVREGRPVDAKLQARTVPLVGFMLFLMAQVFLERHFGGAPTAASTRSGGPSNSVPLGEANCMEAATLFVKNNLSDMVVLAGLNRHGKITQGELAELRLLFREFSQSGQEAPFGTGLGHLWPVQSSAAMSAIDVNSLVMFIRSRLALASEVRNGTALAAVHRGVQAQTVTITSAPPVRPHACLRLQRFTQSTAYVAAALPHTVVSHCVNSMIVLGPVGGCLTLDSLDTCHVVALCAGVVVSRCKNTTLYLCTNNPPVLVGDSNEGLSIAPYDSFYPALEDHLQAAAVSPRLNLFNERIPSSMLLPASEFIPVSIPLPPSSASTTSTVTRSCPCTLPTAYADALAARAKRAQGVATQIQDAHKRLEDAGRRDLAESLRTRVNRAFVEWLESTGQAQCIADLMGGAAASPGAGLSH